MRRQTVYEETIGSLPVGQGFGTAVLRRLSSHSLEGRHWQSSSAFILQAVSSHTGRRWGFKLMRATHVPGSLGSGSSTTRTCTVVRDLLDRQGRAAVEIGLALAFAFALTK